MKLRARRWKPAAILILAAALFWSQAAIAAKVYKYRDKSGTVHIVSDPADVPPEYRDQVEEAGGGNLVVEESEKEESPVTGFLEKLGFRPGGEAAEKPPATSKAGILIRALWRSRLFLSLIFFIVLLPLTAAGMYLSLALPTQRDVKKFMAAVPAFFIIAMIFLWLWAAGPQSLRFLREVRRESARTLTLRDLDVGEIRSFRELGVKAGEWEGSLAVVVWGE